MKKIIIILALVVAGAAYYYGAGTYKGEIEKTTPKITQAEKVEKENVKDNEIVHEKDMPAKHIVILNQEIKDGYLEVSEVNVLEKSWIVIHNVADGKPGKIIGHAAVNAGVDTNIKVKIDAEIATKELIAMLHIDAGKIGEYEFPGADVPLKIGEKIVMEKIVTGAEFNKEEEVSDNSEKITWAEVAKHNSASDCWVVYKGSVYDVTKWLPVHPGGVDKIAEHCGATDFEEYFVKKHGESSDKKIENTLGKKFLENKGEIKE